MQLDAKSFKISWVKPLQKGIWNFKKESQGLNGCGDFHRAQRCVRTTDLEKARTAVFGTSE